MQKHISAVPFEAKKDEIASVMVWGKGDQGQLGLGRETTLTYYPMPLKQL